MIVHLLEYRVLAGHEAEVAGFVRQSLDAPMPAGLLSRCAGRRLAQDGPRHVVVSAWRDPDSFRVGTNAAGVPRYLADKAMLMRRRASGQFRAVASHGTDWDGARLLRLYRASVVPDALELWERSAPEVLGEVANKHGLTAALVGVAMGDPDAADGTPILVLTAWSDWDSLLEATGGRLHRPLTDTELVDFEQHSIADHYDLVDTDAGANRTRST